MLKACMTYSIYVLKNKQPANYHLYNRVCIKYLWEDRQEKQEFLSGRLKMRDYGQR